jgi:hypothetical protein
VKKRKTKPSLSAVIRDLRAQLADTRWQLATAREKLREQRAQDVVDLDALDRCADAVTAHERALFEASPAYRRYQEWRRTGAAVRKGDWRAP